MEEGGNGSRNGAGGSGVHGGNTVGQTGGGVQDGMCAS